MTGWKEERKKSLRAQEPSPTYAQRAATPKISPTRTGGFFVEVHLQEQSVPKKRLLPRLIQYPYDLFPIIFCSVFVLVV